MKYCNFFVGFGTIAAVTFLLIVSGCGKQDTPTDNANAGSGQTAHDEHAGHDHADHDHADHAEHDHAGHDHADHEDNAEKIKETLAKLSPADREAVEKQKVCPVTGEALGSMGPPIKVTVNGRDVFICCAGCEAPLKKEPEKYLAKLPK